MLDGDALRMSLISDEENCDRELNRPKKHFFFSLPECKNRKCSFEQVNFCCAHLSRVCISGDCLLLFFFGIAQQCTSVCIRQSQVNVPMTCTHHKSQYGCFAHKTATQISQNSNSNLTNSVCVSTTAMLQKCSDADQLHPVFSYQLSLLPLTRQGSQNSFW